MPLATTITTEEDIEITCLPTDADGKPAQLQAGTFGVASPNTMFGPAVVTSDGVEDANGAFVYTAVIPNLGSAGQTGTLTVSGDADLGDGVQTITDTVDVTIAHAMAKNLGLTVRGVPKVAPTPAP